MIKSWLEIARIAGLGVVIAIAFGVIIGIFSLSVGATIYFTLKIILKVIV